MFPDLWAKQEAIPGQVQYWLFNLPLEMCVLGLKLLTQMMNTTSGRSKVHTDRTFSQM